MPAVFQVPEPQTFPTPWHGHCLQLQLPLLLVPRQGGRSGQQSLGAEFYVTNGCYWGGQVLLPDLPGKHTHLPGARQ